MKRNWVKRTIQAALLLATLMLAQQVVSADEENHAMGSMIEQTTQTEGRTLRAASAPSDLQWNDNSLPRRDFIDVSSYQSWLTATDYKTLKSRGVKGIVVKLTEGESYRNPYAKNQINWAKAAGLKVAVYHFSIFGSTAAAKREATYFVNYAKELGLATSTLMINDAENSTINNATDESVAFSNQLKSLGYSNVKHYCSESWVTSNKMNQTTLGKSNLWIAKYLYGKPSASN